MISDNPSGVKNLPQTSGRTVQTLAVAVSLALSGAALAQEKVHYTYLWHLEQPIYWPDQRISGTDRYEAAWESLQRTNSGAPHPQNNLNEIFGLADRVAAYQTRVRDSIGAISGSAEAGRKSHTRAG